jgi:hypothetical protein
MKLNLAIEASSSLYSVALGGAAVPAIHREFRREYP